jgi:hypothetical protein
METTASFAQECIKPSLGWLNMPALAGFYFASRLCLSYLFFQSDPKLGAIVASALNMLFLLLVVLYSFGPPASTLTAPLRVSCFRWVLAFLGFSLISLAWSATASLSVAFGYWLCMAADVLIVLLLLRTGPAFSVGSRLIGGFTCGACLIACVMWLSPTMQDLRPGNDDFFSPNAIGFTCAFGVFFAQLLARRESGWTVVQIFLAVSLLRSLSKTTIAAFVAGQLLILARDKTIPRRNKAWVVVTACLVLGAFWNLILAYYNVYLNTGNEAETLTGRIGIWSFVLARSVEQPWIGHGFHSFRNVIPPFGTFEPWHAHNELIQQFYAYGVAGIVLLLGVYGSFYLQARRIADLSYRSICLGLILFIAVRGLADTERFDLSFPLWSIALIVLMFAPADRRSEVVS